MKGRKIQYVKLNPIDTNSEIKHVLLGIDATTKHIYNLIEVGKTYNLLGQVYEYSQQTKLSLENYRNAHKVFTSLDN